MLESLWKRILNTTKEQFHEHSTYQSHFFELTCSTVTRGSYCMSSSKNWRGWLTFSNAGIPSTVKSPLIRIFWVGMILPPILHQQAGVGYCKQSTHLCCLCIILRFKPTLRALVEETPFLHIAYFVSIFIICRISKNRLLFFFKTSLTFYTSYVCWDKSHAFHLQVISGRRRGLEPR